MKALAALVSVLGVFFMVLNGLGGVISGIWLALLGDWGAIGWGFLGMVSAHFLIGIALVPSFAFGAGGLALAQRGSRWGALSMGILSSLYIVIVMTVWCALVLYVFASRATSGASLAALLIWSYGVALGPWAYLASKDEQTGTGSGSSLLTFFGQIAYLTMIVVGIVAAVSFITMAKVFLGVMLVGVAILVATVYSELDLMVADAQTSTEDKLAYLERMSGSEVDPVQEGTDESGL